jgi:hypothetical protein
VKRLGGAVNGADVVVKPEKECAACHTASAKKDDLWTQIYPLLDN